MDNKKYDRVFSVGCFDQFHYGHKKILNTMRNYGNELIIGIHDDESIEKLKNLSKLAHKPLQERLKDLKPYCDRVFIINSTDPIIIGTAFNIKFSSRSCSNTYITITV